MLWIAAVRVNRWPAAGPCDLALPTPIRQARAMVHPTLGRLLRLGLSVVLALGLAGCGPAAMSISYWIIDDRTIGVEALDGPNETCAVARTLETSTDVVVVVECQRPFLSAGSTGAGYPYQFVVPLETPLAGRTVLDAFAAPAALCAAARCGR
jgi:hypothetical protein